MFEVFEHFWEVGRDWGFVATEIKPLSQRCASRDQWMIQEDCVHGLSNKVRDFKWVRDIIRPQGASDKSGNASCRRILRRGARSKKSRSRVTDILLLGIRQGSNVVRFDRVSKDERSPSKIAS